MFRSLIALAVCVASCPAADPPAKDALGDPLPKGASARLGTERMRNLTGYASPRLHPDGKRVIANISGKYTLLDPATGNALGPFSPADNRRAIAALSADGSRAASVTNGVVSVWSSDSGKALFETKLQTGYDPALQLTPDGKFLAVGGRADPKDKEKPVAVTVFDVDAQKEIASLKVVQNQSARLLLSADGKRGVSWGQHYEQSKPGQPTDEEKNYSRVIQFWDVEKQTELGRGRMPNAIGVGSVAISAAGDRVAASVGDGTITLFDPASGKKVKELLGRSRVGSTLTFSPDGKTLAAAAVDGAIQMWEVESGKSLGVAPAPAAFDYLPLLSLVFTSPTQAVALAQIGRATVVWEVPSGKMLSPTVGHRESITGVAFTADGKEVVTSAYSGEILRWDTAGKSLGGISLTTPGAVHNPFVSNRVLIPTGCGLFVRGDRSGSLGVFELPSGVQRFSLPVPFATDPVVGFSADGKRMVTATSNGFSKTTARLTVVDITANTKTADVELGAGTVSALVVTPDGKTAGAFRSTQDDKGNPKTVYTSVDLMTGKTIGEAEFKEASAPRAAAAPDNKTLVVNRSLVPTDVASSGLAVIDVTDGKKVKDLEGLNSYVSAGPVFSSDGKRMAVAGDPSGVPVITVFDWTTGKPTHTFRGHTSAVSALTFSADGKALATGSYDSTVLLWDLSKEQ